MSRFSVVEDSFEVQGLRVEILHHDDPYDEFNPRDGDRNLARLACWHSRHYLGDEQIERDQFENKSQAAASFGLCVAIRPIYCLDHGAINLSCRPYDDPWDAYQVGWAYVTEQRAKEFGVLRFTPHQLNAAIEAEVRAYNAYLQGEMYRYNILAPDGELLEYVGGYYDLAECREAAVTAAEEEGAATSASARP